jgi:hypothetical protein
VPGFVPLQVIIRVRSGIVAYARKIGRNIPPRC